MLRKRGRHSHIAWVYGAACAVAGERAAPAATKTALASASRRDEQMVAAVRTAVALDPADPLARLPLEEREPLALVRLLGLDVDAIAAVVGCDRGEVKARMRAGLTRLSEAPALVAY